MCRCRARASSVGGTSAAVTAPIVPGAVRIARSRPSVRMTLAPVGWASGSTRTARHVEAALAHRLEHEPAKSVVADDADERDAQPEPGGARRP